VGDDFVFALALTDCGHGGVASGAKVPRDRNARLVRASGSYVLARNKLVLALGAAHWFVSGGNRGGAPCQLSGPAFESGFCFDFAREDGEQRHCNRDSTYPDQFNR